MQGADRINKELEVGFDQTFEKRWSRVERGGCVFLGLFVAAGLAGLYGRGPYSHRSRTMPESGLTVDFEPITRSQCDTQVTFHLDNPTGLPELKLFLDTRFVEPMGLSKFLPQPVRTDAVGGGLLLTIAVPPGTRDAELRIMLQLDSTIGPEHLVARLGDHAPLHWTQYVIP